MGKGDKKCLGGDEGCPFKQVDQDGVMRRWQLGKREGCKETKNK